METKFAKATIEEMFAEVGITPKMVDEISIRCSLLTERARAEWNKQEGFRWSAKSYSAFEISLTDVGIKLFKIGKGDVKSSTLFLYSDVSNIYVDSTGFLEIQMTTDAL